MNMELGEHLLNIMQKAETLFETCGSSAIEYNFRKKISELAQKDHEAEMKRIIQRTEKLIELNNQERINAEQKA